MVQKTVQQIRHRIRTHSINTLQQQGIFCEYPQFTIHHLKQQLKFSLEEFTLIFFFPRNILPSGLIMYFMQRHPGHATRISGEEASFYYAPFHFRLQRKIKDKSIISESSH